MNQSDLASQTLLGAYSTAVSKLVAAGVPDCARAARELARLVWPDSDLLSVTACDAGDVRRFDGLVAALEQGTPLSHLLGYADFLGRRYHVTSDTMTPREHTTQLLVSAGRAAVVAIWHRRRQPVRLLDVGTGTGNVVSSVVGSLPAERVTGLAIDVSAAALAVAKSNIDGFGLRRRVSLARMDLTSAVGRQAQVVVANLPYVAAPPSRLAREPRVALAGGGPDGLDLIGRLLEDLPRILADDAYFCLEIPPSRADRALLTAQRTFPAATVLCDRAGVPRVVVGGTLDPAAEQLGKEPA